MENNWLRRRVLREEDPGRQQPCWGFLFCTNLTQPTGALDSKSGKQVLELFESLNESGVTVVVITHDRKVAEQAKRIVHIIDGEITEEGQEAGNEKEKEN